MSFDLIKSFKTLQRARAELADGQLSTEAAEALLTTLETLQNQSRAYQSDLMQMRLLTLNLVVASARAGMEGALQGLSAQLVYEVAEKAGSSADTLLEQVLILEQEIQSQLSPSDLESR